MVLLWWDMDDFSDFLNVAAHDKQVIAGNLSARDIQKIHFKIRPEGVLSACHQSYNPVFSLFLATMGLAVLPPEAEEAETQVASHYGVEGDSDSDTSMYDDDGRPSKRPRLSSGTIGQIVLPGELVTDETQWMR
jgi:hypothetical protein